MKSNIVLLEPRIETIGDKLFRMQELRSHIKILQAEKDMLEDQVKSEYFLAGNHEEYRTDKGLLVASYKSYVENRFNSKKFETDHPDYYSMYKEEKTIFKFLLK